MIFGISLTQAGFPNPKYQICVSAIGNIRYVSLPKEMTRAMAAEAEASREAKAKLIKAEGEIKAAHFLQKASASLSESPYALQLKYLQTLGSLANAKDSTIVFPVPIDIEFYKQD